MSMNKFMHPRNIYRTPPNFKQMAIDYPEFRKHVNQELTGKVTLDFKDNRTLKSLTQTLLKKDFDLDVIIPIDRLIPTIPLRLNYILWVEDLLTVIPDTSSDIHGIDIGTGASCVYPLLASKKNKWKMTATEIDLESINIAQENINRNDLQHLIQLKLTTGLSFLKDVLDPDTTYDFCMCNPPFFSSPNQLDPNHQSRNENRPLPRNAFSGKNNEVIAMGGEIEFLGNLIKESVDLRSQVKIFSTMVGHKSSTAPLKFLLRSVEVVSFKQTEFHQGHTTRWGLAWTFQDIDLRKVPQHLPTSKKKAKRPLSFILPNCAEITSLNSVLTIIRNMLQTLQTEYEEIRSNQNMYAFEVTAKENTWSHQRRKRREQLRKQYELNTGTKEGNDKMNADGPSTSTDYGEDKMDIDFEDSNTSTGSLGHKRIRDADSDEEYFDSKKVKCDKKEAILKFNLIVRKIGKEFHLEMVWVEGTTGRDTLYQIMQYFKNNYDKNL